MERRDAIVAGAGAAILAIALVLTAVGAGSGTQPFAVAFSTAQQKASPVVHSPIAAQDRVTFPWNGSNLSSVSVNVALSGVLPPSASAHVVVTAPNGTKLEGTFTPPSAGGAFDGTLSTSVATVPVNRTVDAHDAAEAVRAAAEPNATAGVGTWTVELSYSSGTPAPLPLAPTSSATFTIAWTTWSAVASPVAPAVK